MALTYAELFAGAGGMSLGLEAGGFHAAAHAEIEPHARAVLRHRWPDTRLDGDVTQVNGADYAGITLLSGGSPCQDLSVAGKRAGLTGSRSSLFHEQVRIWHESGAPYLLWENVAGALSSNHGKDFATVLSTIVGSTVAVPADGWRGGGGVVAGRDAVAAFRVLDLQHFGPPQRRVRIFVLAARAGGVDPAEVLSLSEGVCGHPSPRQQSREGTAARARGGVEGGVRVGAFNWKMGAKAHSIGWAEEEAPSVTGEMTPAVIAWDNELNASVVPYTASRFAPYEEGIGQLRASGGDLGGGSETILAFHHKQTPISGEVAPAIGRPTDGMGVLAFDAFNQTAGDVTSTLGVSAGRVYDNGVICTTGDVTHALTLEGADASEDGTGRGTPTVVCAQSYAARSDVAPTLDTGMAHGNRGPTLFHSQTVSAESVAKQEVQSLRGDADPQAIQNAPFIGRPRRLTPLEAERLMSWPDQWTATGRKDDGTAYALSDTARYRLCGNGVGSVCAEWIAKRLHDAIQRQEEA